MMRARMLATAWCLAIAMALLGISGRAQAGLARVSYVTSRTVYLDAGSTHGLRVGDLVEVLRDGAVIGTIRVRELSERRSACDWTEGPVLAVVGDLARYEDPTTLPAPIDSGSSWWERSGLRGRLGLQTLHVRDLSGVGLDLDRPALALRLRGDAIGGSAFSVEADVRAHRLHRTDGTDSSTRTRSRVVRLNATSRVGSMSLVVGRQYIPNLRAVYSFDGARLEHTSDRWSLGLLAGTQPDPVDFGFSTSVREVGVWATRRVAGPRTRWELTTTAIGSYEQDTLDREFVLLQSRFERGSWMSLLEQEIDVNRSWKKDAGESTLSSTSTHVGARWQIDRTWSLDGGFDNRRRARTYRDRETPETAFDDAYRRGAWLGVNVRPARALDLGLRARRSSGGEASAADILTLTAAYSGPAARGLRLTTRSSVYRNELVEGFLQSATLGRTIAHRFDLGVFGGVRRERGRENDLMDGADPWVGVEIDLTLPRSTWIGATYERTLDGEEAFEQIWVGSGVRF
jgi:hypothetical protein